jgi:hypothetical protein
MSGRGTLAWRADQRVMRLAADGSISSQLAAEPGQRILGITVSGPRAVAVIEAGGAKPWRRARWLAIEDKLAWGAWIAGGTEVGSTIALSPNGKRLARLASTSKGLVQAIVIETATGTTIANEPAPGVLALGFADDEHVALGSVGGVHWIDLTATRRASPTTSVTRGERELLGVGGGRAITSISGELVIATPSKTEFLGYALQSPAVVAAAPGGRMLIGLGDSFALLDGKLQAGPAPDLEVAAGSAIADLRWLAADDWLVETSRVNDGVTSISLVDVKQHKSVPVRTGMAIVQRLMHDPSTQLVTLSLGELPEVLRHEPGKLKLARIATLPRPAGFERAELVRSRRSSQAGTQPVVHARSAHAALVRDPRALEKGVAVTIGGRSQASIPARSSVAERSGHAGCAVSRRQASARYPPRPDRRTDPRGGR